MLALAARCYAMLHIRFLLPVALGVVRICNDFPVFSLVAAT